MRLSSVLTGSLLISGGLLAASPDAEASFKTMTTNDMVDASDFIVRGTVTETWTEVGEHGRIWTRAQLDVTRTYKGDTDLQTIVIDQLGGQYAGVTMHVDSAARFSYGEEIVVFLDELNNGRICPLSMFAGKWTVRMDPYTQENIVQRFTVEAGETYDHRFLPLPPAAARIYLTDFETKIVDRMSIDTQQEVK